MPQQLIYTSAPRGIVAGRSGHCTVARSATMRDALVLRLEQLSYYQHLSLSGGKERPIFAYRIVDIRGSRFHVLSRIQDAGLDFTGRTNFIAHHLALAPEEFRQFPTPPIILRDWPGWVKSWTREPALLENEDWSALVSLAGKSSVPAQTWKRVTGDAANGYGLLEARAGATFRVDDQTDETVLGLFAESIELLEVRDARRDFRAAAPQYTFTTSMQEQDNPADFRWRCIHADNPAANRLATPDCRNLSSVRANRTTEEEAAFARSGRQAPRFVVEPQDVQTTEGGTAQFFAKAEGIPRPTYQWFSVDRTDNGQPLAGETNPELALPNPALGKSRYVVQVSNSAGDVMSRVATLSVEQKLRLAQSRRTSDARPIGTVPPKTASEIESQRKHLEAAKAEKRFFRKQRLKRMFVICSLALAVVLAIAGVILMNPKLRSNLGNHLGPILSRLHISTGQANPPPHTDDSSSQPLATKEASQPANIVQNATEKSGTNDEDAKFPNPLTLKESNLPIDWKLSRVGGLDDTCSRDFTNGQIELRVAAMGLRSNKDDFLFFCYTYTGKSFEATLGTNIFPEKAAAGIMIRNSEEDYAPFLFIGKSSTNIFTCTRTNAHGICKSNLIGSYKGSPIILKLSQDGTYFTASYWTPARNWPDITSFASGEHALVGLAVWSGNPGKQATLTFTNVTGLEVPKNHQ
jgi:hypothetical protein